ncbi:hypothetical protein ABRP76_13410 [Pectobacterium aroidearum]
MTALYTTENGNKNGGETATAAACHRVQRLNAIPDENVALI